MWASMALLARSPSGPAVTCSSRTPPPRSVTSGWSGAERRVTMSTVWPRAARACAWCSSTTFIPPASPAPGEEAGEVCIDTNSNRRLTATT